jgi:tetratricopeptide (TPR) repeat protein
MELDPQLDLDPCQKCLAILTHGANALHEGNLEVAEKCFALGLALAKETPPDEARDLVPLALFGLSLFCQRQSRPDESQKLRESATARFDDQTASMPVALFHHLMVNFLMALGEYRRAIPFCEQAILLERRGTSPTIMAEMLWHAGECYNRCGMKDHAAIPLRAAVKIFRDHPGDPRLTAVLTGLGNAWRKTAPAEAESCYKEAADLEATRARLQSACPAWVNLGVLCSEQGRYAESLEHYNRVLRVREQSPGTPPSRIASVLNNIANCYRRMAKFAEAFASVDRAIKLLEPRREPGLASAYGTRGLIFRDQGRDTEAVAWLRKASAEHRQQPSPNLETWAEDLENEAAALQRLGKPGEAAAAEEQLRSVRAAITGLPKTIYDLSKVNPETQAAVIVELNVGSHGPNVSRESVDLAHLLREAVLDNDIGFYAGSVRTPETTTLMFYGAEADPLYAVLEPTLRNEPLCAGARVTIRHPNRAVREVLIPTRLM